MHKGDPNPRIQPAQRATHPHLRIRGPVYLRVTNHPRVCHTGTQIPGPEPALGVAELAAACHVDPSIDDGAIDAMLCPLRPLRMADWCRCGTDTEAEDPWFARAEALIFFETDRLKARHGFRANCGRFSDQSDWPVGEQERGRGISHAEKSRRMWILQRVRFQALSRWSRRISSL